MGTLQQRKKVVVAIYDAMGGPEKPEMGRDGNMKTPTKQGQFTVEKCAPHVSVHRYKHWSGVSWGTPLREQKGKLEVYMARSKVWMPLENFTPVTKDEILQEHERLYGKYEIPNKWVFNDFGHMTCYYFKDVNGNKKLDGKEHREGDMIHPTPGNEAQAARGTPNVEIELGGSHGCIHVKPADIDEMIEKSYMKPGNPIFVHPFAENPPSGAVDLHGRFPYEVHFYPMYQKIVVKGTR